MTRDEALSKWCPIVKFDEKCLVDKCAIWVWTTKTKPINGRVEELPESEWQGYCGLTR